MLNPTNSKKLEHDKIIFFDGVCGLCDQFVTILIDIDRKKILRFSPQQGKYFQTTEITVLINPQMGDSIFYYRGGRIFSKSTAVLNALSDLGGVWKICGIFKLIPKPMRDAVYDLVAKNRYQIFGKKESCRLPTAEEKSRFID